LGLRPGCGPDRLGFEEGRRFVPARGDHHRSLLSYLAGPTLAACGCGLAGTVLTGLGLWAWPLLQLLPGNDQQN
jgi:hypothetical protein